MISDQIGNLGSIAQDSGDRLALGTDVRVGVFALLVANVSVFSLRTVKADFGVGDARHDS